jgi:hypothetical protein
MTGGGLVRENQRLILTCIVDAYPPIDTYQWFKNDEKLTLSSSTSSLIIEKVSKHDAGIYTCLAKNTLKYSNGSAIEKSDKTQTRVTVECKRLSLADDLSFFIDHFAVQTRPLYCPKRRSSLPIHSR